MPGETFIVIIAGSREFYNYPLLRSKCDYYLSGISKKKRIKILHGNQRGADKLGEAYAKERGYEYDRFPADWNSFGRAAGPIRNEAMAKQADALIVFWNGSSDGSGNMVKQAKKYKLTIREVRI